MTQLCHGPEKPWFSNRRTHSIFCNLRGMTQKQLGKLVDFPERSADVRMAQYETGARTPKADLTAALAHALDVAPYALSVPDIDTYIGLAHTLFTLEDRYGLTIHKNDGLVCLRVDAQKTESAHHLIQILSAWQKAAAKLESGEITREELSADDGEGAGDPGGDDFAGRTVRLSNLILKGNIASSQRSSK